MTDSYITMKYATSNELKLKPDPAFNHSCTSNTGRTRAPIGTGL